MAEEQTTQTSKNYLTPMAIIMAGVLIAVGIVVKDNPQVLGLAEKNQAAAPVNNNVAPTPSIPVAEEPTIVEVSVDDDAFLGKEDSPITIIEFSDYECPYCKRHTLETVTKLKSKYVDTGIAKYYFRDLVLSFHDPAASIEAEAAECVRSQIGDEGYFKFHDKLFENTLGNGQGIPEEKLLSLVTQVGANSTLVKTCLDSGVKTQEVIADTTYAGEVGAGGTPTTFIGKSTPSGEIMGEMIVGAQPITVFESVIQKYLN